MKSTPSFVRHGLMAFVACGLFFVLAPKHLAAQEDPIRAVRPAAQAWLAMIDSAKFDASYAAGGDGLHQVETQAKWDAFLKYLLPAWGPMVSRKESEHLYQPNGIKGLNGECMAISYDTTFKNLAQARELVIMRFEDGQWRGVGYSAGPKPDPAAAGAYVPPPVTETQTQTVHPGEK